MAMAVVSCRQEHQTQLPFFQSAEFTPEWISITDNAFEKIHTISPFRFLDQSGQWVTNESFDDHPYIANFFFTQCPSICPAMMQNMHALQEYYRDKNQVKFISHTVTPWLDSVAVLKGYADKMQVDADRWHLVTGTQEEIYTLARTSYFADEDIGQMKNTDDFLHTENFLLIDKKGRIRGIYNGTIDQDLIRLKEDLKILLNSE